MDLREGRKERALAPAMVAEEVEEEEVPPLVRKGKKTQLPGRGSRPR